MTGRHKPRNSDWGASDDGQADIMHSLADVEQLTDYRLRIECPRCGAAIGYVTKNEGRPEEIEDHLNDHGHSAEIEWPPRELVEREITRVRRRPHDLSAVGYGPGGWHKRTGRVRARRKA